MNDDKVIALLEEVGAFVYLPKTPGAARMTQCSIEKIREIIYKVEQATLERAAGVCRSWRGGKLLLNAGEMTGQELRTVRAVTEAAANEILRLKDYHD